MPLPKPPDKTPKKPSWNRRADKKQAKISEMQEFEAILKAFSPNNVKSSMLDSGTTCNLNKATDELPITGQSNKSILTATGNIIQTTAMATLPMTQLPDEARTTHILPNLQESLMSVSVLADTDVRQYFILTRVESPSTDPTVSESTSPRRRCSKGGETPMVCGESHSPMGAPAVQCTRLR
jgi:hypothetical protein